MPKPEQSLRGTAGMQQRRIRMSGPDLCDFARIVIDDKNRINADAQLLGDTN